MCVQIALLEESWADLFLLCAIHWSVPMESSPLLAPEIAQNVPNGKAAQAMTDVRLLQEIFNKFKVFQVDAAEFACLKAVALFRPGRRHQFHTLSLCTLAGIHGNLFDILIMKYSAACNENNYYKFAVWAIHMKA